MNCAIYASLRDALRTQQRLPYGARSANAIAYQLCYLHLVVEKRRKNTGFRLFSAKSNKRGMTINVFVQFFFQSGINFMM